MKIAGQMPPEAAQTVFGCSAARINGPLALASRKHVHRIRIGLSIRIRAILKRGEAWDFPKVDNDIMARSG
jgi:hypothetical protein